MTRLAQGGPRGDLYRARLQVRGWRGISTCGCIIGHSGFCRPTAECRPDAAWDYGQWQAILAADHGRFPVCAQASRSTSASISSYCRMPLGTAAPASRVTDWRSPFHVTAMPTLLGPQHRLVTKGLGLKRLRLVLGTSMGGMQTWMWGARYPEMMDALMPIASLPERVVGRNLLWRRLLIKIIQLGEDERRGASSQQPPSLGLAWNLF